MNKNYYQLKGCGHTLPPKIYRKCVNDIKCYPYLKEIVEGEYLSSKQELKPEDMVIDKVTAEKLIREIEEPLYAIPSYYREAVLKKVAYEIPYGILEEKYGASVNTFRKYVQKYIYFYATNIGINFKD